MHKTTMLYMPDIESNYIREFEAKVLRAGEDFVVLDESAFYPLGGGQPSDTGRVQWGQKVSVVKEVKKKGEVVHRLDGDVPSEDEIVKGTLDWGRRYGHMCMHTAQHLVSAVVFDMYGSHTVGNQIHGDRSRIDFHPSEITQEDLPRIEAECNERIEKALPVTIYEQDRDELEKRKDMLRITLDLVPRSVRRLRIIEIQGYDVCPCAGTHIKNLSELGKVSILKRENKGKGRVRVSYSLDRP